MTTASVTGSNCMIPTQLNILDSEDLKNILQEVRVKQQEVFGRYNQLEGEKEQEAYKRHSCLAAVEAEAELREMAAKGTPIVAIRARAKEHIDSLENIKKNYPVKREHAKIYAFMREKISSTFPSLTLTSEQVDTVGLSLSAGGATAVAVGSFYDERVKKAAQRAAAIADQADGVASAANKELITAQQANKKAQIQHKHVQSLYNFYKERAPVFDLPAPVDKPTTLSTLKKNLSQAKEVYSHSNEWTKEAEKTAKRTKEAAEKASKASSRASARAANKLAPRLMKAGAAGLIVGGVVLVLDKCFPSAKDPNSAKADNTDPSLKENEPATITGAQPVSSGPQ